jgi:histidinol-phosphatase (PHP family)
MRTSYHCHTNLSDGGCAISDHIRAGVAAGLDEIGISEHYTLLPGKRVSWSMAQAGLADYFRALRAARHEAGDGIIVRYGLEADFIPESVGELGRILAAYPFDYVIGSVHFIDDFPVDESADYWEALSQDQRNEMIRAYWARVTDMAKSGVFDIAGHLDLYKKFGHRATIDISADIAAALDAIAEAGMAVELNTSGMSYVGEAYPSPAILRECYARLQPRRWRAS